MNASAISWAPGLSIPEMIKRFAAFYLATSLVYDAFRALGNVLLVVLLGAPVIMALRRFRQRFLVEWVPVPDKMQGNAIALPTA